MNKLAIIPAVCLLAACSQYSIRNIDKPAPNDYEGWIDKSGKSVPIIEAKKALLECGAPSINSTAIVYEQALGISISDSNSRLSYGFEVTGCMEKSGYTLRWSSQKEACNYQPHYASFPACQPDAIFADRSVERRLNSWYCRLKTSYAFCLENALNPAMCDKERDHRPPPPECQP